MNRSSLLSSLKKIKIIHKGKVIGHSGKVLDFYCDMKAAYGYPDIVNALADEIGKRLPKSTTCIAASGYGGLPIAAVVASRHGLKFTAVRSSKKDHGRSTLIDGYIPNKKDKIVIVDDVLTTGSSIKDTFSALVAAGHRVHSAIVIVKRGEVILPISYEYIFTVDEILEK